jgi:rhodanese-related sulfurtransferase
MNSLSQLAAITCISLVAASGTYGLKGPPFRKYVCDPASLKNNEVCLETLSVTPKILWVDARNRQDWMKDGISGSVLWNLDSTENMQAFEAEVATRIMETPRVIVYCGDENCGLSHQVAEKIRALQLATEVSVLRGGWRALNEAGRIKDSNRNSSLQ